MKLFPNEGFLFAVGSNGNGRAIFNVETEDTKLGTSVQAFVITFRKDTILFHIGSFAVERTELMLL